MDYEMPLLLHIDRLLTKENVRETIREDMGMTRVVFLIQCFDWIGLCLPEN